MILRRFWSSRDYFPIDAFLEFVVLHEMLKADFIAGLKEAIRTFKRKEKV